MSLLRNRKDWLIVLASLFLLELMPFGLASQENPFVMKRSEKSADSIVKPVEYIVLQKTAAADTVGADIYYVLRQKNDTLKIKQDTTLNTSIFLPSTLRFLKSPPGDSVVFQRFFAPHSLQVKGFQPVNKRKSINDWAFVVLLTGFLLFAGVQFSYHKRMLQIFRAFLAQRFLNQLLRGSDFYKERITYNLYLVFILVFPLFLYEINSTFQFYILPRRPFTELLFYLELFFLNLLIYFIKVLSLRLAGIIFKTREITSEYLMTHFIFSLIQGVVTMVFITVVVFTHSVLILESTIVILSLMYFFQLLRGFFIGLRNAGYSILYLILFFFTIEILPVLVVLKLFSKTFSI